MPRNKSITSIDNRIKKVQEDLFKTKARLDKLAAELRGLEREKKFRQADAILQALSKSGKSLDDVLTFWGVNELLGVESRKPLEIHVSRRDKLRTLTNTLTHPSNREHKPRTPSQGCSATSELF